MRIAPDGEVQTRGPNVFAGYWHNDAAPRAAFDGDWYKTGDLGYIEDGYVFLKGRKKDLIVLSDGQNVYPEDIEAVLRHQPGVTDAVVVGRADGRTYASTRSSRRRSAGMPARPSAARTPYSTTVNRFTGSRFGRKTDFPADAHAEGAAAAGRGVPGGGAGAGTRAAAGVSG